MIKLNTSIAAIAGLLMTASCGSHGNQIPEQQPAEQPMMESPAEEEAQAGLPPLDLERSSSMPFDYEVYGTEYDIKSDTAVELYENSDELLLPSTETQMAWAIYVYPIGEDSPSAIDVDLVVTPGNEANLGVANYSTGRWDFFTPVTESGISSFQLDPAQHRSAEGNVQVTILTSGGNVAIVNAATLIWERLGWQYSTIFAPGGDNSGPVMGPSLALIGGKPAVSYTYTDDAGDFNVVFSQSRHSSHYHRWSDTSWLPPSLVDKAEGLHWKLSSLAEIDGKPAVAYHLDDGLYYNRYGGYYGTQYWNGPVFVHTTTGDYVSLADVNGRPSIAFYDSLKKDLMYLRAESGTGTSKFDWQDLVTVDSEGDTGRAMELLVVNGNPAISSFNITDGGIRYGRSSNETGNQLSRWYRRSHSVDYLPGVPYSSTIPSMAVIAGNPAICFYDRSTGYIRYTRSSNEEGYSPYSWDEKVDIASPDGDPRDCVLEMISGRPAIAFMDDSGKLYYVESSSETGGDSTGWGDVMEVDTVGNAAGWHSLDLIEYEGMPCIAYYDADDKALKFAIQYR